MTKCEPEAKEILEYIAESPSAEYGGFDDRTVRAARWAVEKLAAARAEVERLLQEQEHEIELLQGELAKCRRLLRGVCRDPERVEVDGVRCWEIITTDEWMRAAQAAGGEG